MDIKQRLTAIISIVIAIVVCSTVLIPIVNESTKTTGDVVTVEQTGRLSYNHLSLVEEGETHTVQYFAPIEGETKGTALFDEEPVNIRFGNFTWCVISYGYPIRIEIRNESNAIKIVDGREQLHLLDGETVVITSEKITYGDRTWDIVGDYYCGVSNIPSINSEVETQAYATQYNNIISKESDLILAGNYSVNSTVYSFMYENGILSVDGHPEARIVTEMELIDGYTDIYRLTSFKILFEEDGETIEYEPAFYLVPSLVTGHADSGVLTTLVGIVPVLVIVGLILAVTSTFLIRGRDFDE